MRSRVILFVVVAAALVLSAGQSPELGAQAPSAPYTFTRIAAHGFLQVVEGSGSDPVPQRIDPAGLSINDDGVVAFGHLVDIFALARTVVSAGDGRALAQIYGGGVLAPVAGRTGIDGDGSVYFGDFITGNHAPVIGPVCGPGFIGICLFDSRRTVNLALSRPGFWIVNGIHSRLRLTGADRVAYLLETANGMEIRTESGRVAAEGSVFSSIGLQEVDINGRGDVTFTAQSAAGFGIFAGRAGEAPRAIFLNDGSSSLGQLDMRNPRIDDTGRVFFVAFPLGAQRPNLYRFDPGALDPVLLVDGVGGPLVPEQFFSVNAAGSLAFLATPAGGGPLGIYTGPDPVSDKLIAIGDSLDGRQVVALQLDVRAVNNNGLDGRGQIAFAARLDGDDGFSVYRANPPGSDPSNPILPPAPGAPPVFRFPRLPPPVGGGTRTYWDPPFAVGYEYRLEAGDPGFESVLLPTFENHDTYEVQLWDGAAYETTATVAGGVEHRFPEGGVDRFRIMGIPESLGLDVHDPQALVTGLRFVGPGSVQLTMTPVALLPPPATINWAAPSPIVYGTALGPEQLDATSTSAGTFEYTPGAGTVPDAGQHTLAVTFTPTDSAQTPVTASVLLQVARAPLTITAADKSMRIGDPLPTLTAIYRVFANSETPGDLDIPVVLSTTASGDTAGTFPIAASGASDTNYDITFHAGTLTVRPREAKCLEAADRTVLWPLNPSGTSVFKKGSSVVVRFRACAANGKSIGTPGLVTGFSLVGSEPGTASGVNELPLFLPPSSAFQWNPYLQEWFYVLSTRTLAASRTYTYRISLRDGTVIPVRFGVR